MNEEEKLLADLKYQMLVNHAVIADYMGTHPAERKERPRLQHEYEEAKKFNDLVGHSEAGQILVLARMGAH